MSHCIQREARLATCFLVACSVADDSQPLQDIESFSACDWECLRERKPRPNQCNPISTGKYPTNISPLHLLRCWRLVLLGLWQAEQCTARTVTAVKETVRHLTVTYDYTVTEFSGCWNILDRLTSGGPKKHSRPEWRIEYT